MNGQQITLAVNLGFSRGFGPGEMKKRGSIAKNWVNRHRNTCRRNILYHLLSLTLLLFCCTTPSEAVINAGVKASLRFSNSPSWFLLEISEAMANVVLFYSYSQRDLKYSTTLETLIMRLLLSTFMNLLTSSEAR